MQAVIQAGGKGTRLRPYTMVVPKPIMPLGDQPVIEVLLKWLRRWDVNEIFITLGYLGHLIRALCGDGSQWDMKITYSEESEPLGTIGPLQLIRDQLREPFIVLNGDLITDLDLGAFINFHWQHDGLVSVGVTDRPVVIDFGVLEGHSNRLTTFKEKPKLHYQVSMGIYCMDPAVLELIPRNVPFGFDALMHAMLSKDLPVYLYQHEGIWMDLGRTEDFCRAQEVFMREYKSIILGG